MAGKIVGTIIVSNAVNGVTGRGAVTGAVVRFSIIRVLACIVVALALLGPAFAERTITASYGVLVAKSCSFPSRLGQSI